MKFHRNMIYSTNIVVFVSVSFLILGTSLVNGVNHRDNRFHDYPEKRPFCNAFTGCGRKRSESDSAAATNSNHNDEQMTADQLNQMQTPDDRLNDLLDLNSEPAVEDLMRQIMSQAKLWEAIQEANREMIIQKNQRNAQAHQRFPLAFSAQ